MQLYFIRHAQSSNNALWLTTGSSNGRLPDPDLTDTGRQQAARLAQFLRFADPRGGCAQETASAPDNPGFGFTHLYSSLMLRAVATGAAIAAALDLPLFAWEDAHEQGGIYLQDEAGVKNGLPGCTRSYFQAHFPNLSLPDGLDDSGWWRCRPCETFEESYQRAGRLLQALLERHGDSEDRVAVVSHGGFYNDFLLNVFQLPWQETLWFRLYNTGITRIDYAEERVRITYLNRTDHLPPELLT